MTHTIKRRPATRSGSRIRRNPSSGKISREAIGRDILAVGLSTAAAAISASPNARKAIREAGLHAADAANEAAASVMMNASSLGSIIANAVADAAQRVLAGADVVHANKSREGESAQFIGQGMGKLISSADLERRLRSVIDDESTDWADSRLLGVLEAAESIGVARSTLDQWRRRKRVLAFSKGLRNYVFPMDQFVGSKPLPGLEKVRASLGTDEDAWEWLVTPERMLGDRTPIEWLREGHVDEVVRAAEGALDFA